MIGQYEVSCPTIKMENGNFLVPDPIVMQSFDETTVYLSAFCPFSHRHECLLIPVDFYWNLVDSSYYCIRGIFLPGRHSCKLQGDSWESLLKPFLPEQPA